MMEDQPYKCDHCDKSFRWEVSLITHRREHRSINGGGGGGGGGATGSGGPAAGPTLPGIAGQSSPLSSLPPCTMSAVLSAAANSASASTSTTYLGSGGGCSSGGGGGGGGASGGASGGTSMNAAAAIAAAALSSGSVGGANKNPLGDGCTVDMSAIGSKRSASLNSKPAPLTPSPQHSNLHLHQPQHLRPSVSRNPHHQLVQTAGKQLVYRQRTGSGKQTLVVRRQNDGTSASVNSAPASGGNDSAGIIKTIVITQPSTVNKSSCSSSHSTTAVKSNIASRSLANSNHSMSSTSRGQSPAANGVDWELLTKIGDENIWNKEAMMVGQVCFGYSMRRWGRRE